MNKKIVEIATVLYGHLAPGVAVGLRMSELALMRFLL
jgi:formylmethanofuran dehydrogenase subunit E